MTTRPPGFGRRRAALVAGGGAVGAALRWAAGELGSAPTPDGVPWVLIGVNVAGSLLLAVVVARYRSLGDRGPVWLDGLGAGLCGGLTTFSGVAVVLATQLRDGQAGVAVLTVILMVGLTLSAAITARLVVAPHRAEPRRGPSR